MSPRTTSPPADLTPLLNRWASGARDALDELIPMVLDELRTLARHHLAKIDGRRLDGEDLLQPTVLVNELYLRLTEARVESFENRHRFFAFASRLIRDALHDAARERRAAKRGGGRAHADLDETLALGAPVDLDTWLDIDRALTRLEEIHPRQARVVELRLFGGLTVAEIASVVERSSATVERDWAIGRRRLARSLASDERR